MLGLNLILFPVLSLFLKNKQEETEKLPASDDNVISKLECNPNSEKTCDDLNNNNLSSSCN